jgi:hypothetical protein
MFCNAAVLFARRGFLDAAGKLRVSDYPFAEDGLLILLMWDTMSLLQLVASVLCACRGFLDAAALLGLTLLVESSI